MQFPISAIVAIDSSHFSVQMYVSKWATQPLKPVSIVSAEP